MNIDRNICNENDLEETKDSIDQVEEREDEKIMKNDILKTKITNLNKALFEIQLKYVRVYQAMMSVKDSDMMHHLMNTAVKDLYDQITILKTERDNLIKRLNNI